jgi:hypothetical protein
MKRLTVVALLWAGIACGGADPPADSPDEADSAPEAAAAPRTWSATEIGTLAAQIRRSPEVADSLLTAHGLDAQRLDSIVYAIAEDAEATAEYLAALNR